MARRPASRSPKPRKVAPAVAPSRRRGVMIGVAIVVVALITLMIWAGRPRPLTSPMREAQKALERGEAARAEKSLIHATQLDPGNSQPWLLLLELLRVEDRQLEAQEVGWRAYQAVPESSRRKILRAMTLALLADTPEDLARTTLARWIEADPTDVDARVALLQRISMSPRSEDPDRAARVASLSAIVAEAPQHIAAHEALALALADSGEPDQGREVLKNWPILGRDARYARLKGRWDLEYDHQPAAAVEAFRESLKALPHDWRTRYRLARALRNAGLEVEAKKASTDVEKLREALDPLALGRRLDKNLAALDDPRSRLDLADLCKRAGLWKLALAWKHDSENTGISRRDAEKRRAED